MSSSRRLVLAIVGSTGTGKSGLAVEMARRYNGEVVNADALQMYEGLPVTTNIIPEHDRKGITHHLLAVTDPGKAPITVGHFVDRARNVIDDIHSRGKLAIVTGGTNFYLQSLLLRDTILESDKPIIPASQIHEKWPILRSSTERIYAELQQVDPVSAARWHPLDRRKIQTSLQIFLESGTPASTLYAAQEGKHVPGSTDPMTEPSQARLRYQTLVFWTYREKSVLDASLDGRVCEMVGEGMLQELRRLHNTRKEMEATNAFKVDLSRGIWIAIGYKEFQRWLELSPTASASESQAALKEGLDLTKIANHQYAQSQVKRLRGTFFPALRRSGAGPIAYLFDITNLDDLTKIYEQASDVLNKKLSGEPLPNPFEFSSTAARILGSIEGHVDTRLAVVKTCELCQKTATTTVSWANHLNSHRHKKQLRHQRRRSGSGIDRSAIRSEGEDL